MIKAILMIIIGSLIGWITNFFAIKMMFRPMKEINILGLKIQGLIPKRKMEIGENIAETIQDELISMKDITEGLSELELEEEIEAIVDKVVEDKLKNEILAKIPMASLFINDRMIDKIKGHVKDGIDENKDEFFKQIAMKLEKAVDLKKIIMEKIEMFELEELEEIVYKIASNELKHIELIGAILGGVIGGLQFIVSIYL